MLNSSRNPKTASRVLVPVTTEQGNGLTLPWMTVKSTQNTLKTSYLEGLGGGPKQAGLHAPQKTGTALGTSCQMGVPVGRSSPRCGQVNESPGRELPSCWFEVPGRGLWEAKGETLKRQEARREKPPSHARIYIKTTVYIKTTSGDDPARGSRSGCPP